MFIRFSCPSCKAGIKAPEKQAGEKVLCPRCGQQLEVPFQMIVSPSAPSPCSELPPPPAPVRIDEEDLSGSRLSPTARMGLIAGIVGVALLGGTVILVLVVQQQEPKPSVPAKQVAGHPEESWQRTAEPRREMGRQDVAGEPAEEQTAPRNPAPVNKDEEKQAGTVKREPPPSAEMPQQPKDKPSKTEVAQPLEDKPSNTKRAIGTDPTPPEGTPPQQSSGKAKSKEPSNDRTKKQQDLPDVSFVIPEDTRPEVRAILKENVINIRSKKASERVKAAEILGELKQEAKPARGLLCLAMLDPHETVRIAAADALKNIDPKMQYLAVGLLTGQGAERSRLLAKIQKLEDDGEPLSPLVAHGALRSAAQKDAASLSQELTVLSHIAKKDRVACQLIASALANPSEALRRSSIDALGRMKHGSLAVSGLITLLKTDTAENRIAVMRTLVVLADKSTEEIIAEAIATQRYHNQEKVRKAAEEALNKLQNKKDP